MFVETEALSDYTDSDYKYTALTFNDTTSLVYSTLVPQLPVTATRVEVEPCMDPTLQSASEGQEYYKAEVNQLNCVQEKNTNLVYDPLYSSSGLYISLFEVQSENDVLKILQGSPNYDLDISTSRKEDIIGSWNRPTINWSLTCENEGYSREFAYESLGFNIESSSEIHTIVASGKAMCVFYAFGLLLVSVLVYVLCAGNNYNTEEVPKFGLLALVLGRIIYYIIGPIIGFAIFDAVK